MNSYLNCWFLNFIQLWRINIKLLLVSVAGQEEVSQDSLSPLTDKVLPSVREREREDDMTSHKEGGSWQGCRQGVRNSYFVLDTAVMVDDMSLHVISTYSWNSYHVCPQSSVSYVIISPHGLLSRILPNISDTRISLCHHIWRLPFSSPTVLLPFRRSRCHGMP